uniref:Uncharacterized protein n=1 Tax=Oryza punctata TaxID=4537 RepID=A0A0E0M5E2_ORYPU
MPRLLEHHYFSRSCDPSPIPGRRWESCSLRWGRRWSSSSPADLRMEEEEPPFSHIATDDVEAEGLLGGGGGGCRAHEVVATKELSELLGDYDGGAR